MAEGVRIFIGSSGKAYDRIVTPLRAAILRIADESDHVDTWKDDAGVGNNEHILSALLRRLEDSDFGIFIFAADDPGQHGQQMVVRPRDNVVFEAGMFVARLGPERTYIVLERNAHELTDIQGLQHLELDTRSESRLNAGCDDIARRIIKDVRRLKSVDGRERRERIAEHGLATVLATQREHIDDIERRLTESTPAQPLHDPVVFGDEACVQAYVDALDLVQKTFWTTTYFSSGFWQSNAGDVLAANKKMLARVGGMEGADIRRLFLLPHDSDSFLMEEREEVGIMRRLGDRQRILEKENDLQKIERYINDLIDNGCQVKIGFDDGSRIWSSTLSEELRRQGDASGTEIALFDTSRIDLYQGGKTGHIARIAIFPNTLENFDVHLQTARAYFETLWQNAQASEPFLVRRRQNLDRWKQRIDYDSNWIAKYEYGLRPSDHEIKESELNAAQEIVRTLTKTEKIGSYLDIGTCTARYPIALLTSEVLKGDARIVAVDEDGDCIAFARGRLNEKKLLSRVKLVSGDFMGDGMGSFDEFQFELITCMLGTISHFGAPVGRDETVGYPGIVSAVRRMHARLSANGSLLIGNWSEDARRDRRFLSIYSPADIKSLQAWTPTRPELTRILTDSGLKVTRVVPAHLIDVFVAQRA